MEKKQTHKFNFLLFSFLLFFFSCSVESSADAKDKSTKTQSDDLPYYDGQKITEEGQNLVLSVPPVKEEIGEIQGKELEEIKQQYEPQGDTQ